MDKKKFISKYIENFCKVIKSGELQINQLLDAVNLSQGVRIYSKIDDYLKYRKENKTILGSVEIDNNVIIGSGTVIVGHCKIAEGATVGALSLVKGNLRKWSINAGIPAKFIRPRRR